MQMVIFWWSSVLITAITITLAFLLCSLLFSIEARKYRYVLLNVMVDWGMKVLPIALCGYIQ